MITMKIRQTHARTYRTCKRKYKLQAIDKLISIEKAPALSIGTACHAGRAEWLRSKDADAAIKAAIKSIDAEISTFPSLVAQEQETKRIIVEVIASYCLEFPKRFPDNAIKVIAIEVPFEVKLAEYEDLEMYLIGTGDALVNFAEKYVMNFEFKTTKKTLPQFFKEEYLSIQHTTYCYAYQEVLGIPVYGTLLDATRKPLATKGPEHDHVSIPKTDDDIAEFRRDMTELLREIYYSIDNDYFPPNFDACFTTKGTCEYHDICRSRFDPHILRNKYGVVDDIGQIISNENPD